MREKTEKKQRPTMSYLGRFFHLFPCSRKSLEEKEPFVAVRPEISKPSSPMPYKGEKFDSKSHGWRSWGDSSAQILKPESEEQRRFINEDMVNAMSEYMAQRPFRYPGKNEPEDQQIKQGKGLVKQKSVETLSKQLLDKTEKHIQQEPAKETLTSIHFAPEPHFEKLSTVPRGTESTKTQPLVQNLSDPPIDERYAASRVTQVSVPNRKESIVGKRTKVCLANAPDHKRKILDQMYNEVSRNAQVPSSILEEPPSERKCCISRNQEPQSAPKANKREKIVPDQLDKTPSLETNNVPQDRIPSSRVHSNESTLDKLHSDKISKPSNLRTRPTIPKTHKHRRERSSSVSTSSVRSANQPSVPVRKQSSFEKKSKTQKPSRGIKSSVPVVNESRFVKKPLGQVMKDRSDKRSPLPIDKELHSKKQHKVVVTEPTVKTTRFIVPLSKMSNIEQLSSAAIEKEKDKMHKVPVEHTDKVPVITERPFKAKRPAPVKEAQHFVKRSYSSELMKQSSQELKSLLSFTKELERDSSSSLSVAKEHQLEKRSKALLIKETRHPVPINKEHHCGKHHKALVTDFSTVKKPFHEKLTTIPSATESEIQKTLSVPLTKESSLDTKSSTDKDSREKRPTSAVILEPHSATTLVIIAKEPILKTGSEITKSSPGTKAFVPVAQRCLDEERPLVPHPSEAKLGECTRAPVVKETLHPVPSTKKNHYQKQHAAPVTETSLAATDSSTAKEPSREKLSTIPSKTESEIQKTPSVPLTKVSLLDTESSTDKDSREKRPTTAVILEPHTTSVTIDKEPIRKTGSEITKSTPGAKSLVPDAQKRFNEDRPLVSLPNKTKVEECSRAPVVKETGYPVTSTKTIHYEKQHAAPVTETSLAATDSSTAKEPSREKLSTIPSKTESEIQKTPSVPLTKVSLLDTKPSTDKDSREKRPTTDVILEPHTATTSVTIAKEPILKTGSDITKPPPGTQSAVPVAQKLFTEERPLVSLPNNTKIEECTTVPVEKETPVDNRPVTPVTSNDQHISSVEIEPPCDIGTFLAGVINDSVDSSHFQCQRSSYTSKPLDSPSCSPDAIEPLGGARPKTDFPLEPSKPQHVCPDNTKPSLETMKPISTTANLEESSAESVERSDTLQESECSTCLIEGNIEPQSDLRRSIESGLSIPSPEENFNDILPRVEKPCVPYQPSISGVKEPPLNSVHRSKGSSLEVLSDTENFRDILPHVSNRNRSFSDRQRGTGANELLSLNRRAKKESLRGSPPSTDPENFRDILPLTSGGSTSFCYSRHPVLGQTEPALHTLSPSFLDMGNGSLGGSTSVPEASNKNQPSDSAKKGRK